jgi:hypothetical protein
MLSGSRRRRQGHYVEEESKDLPLTVTIQKREKHSHHGNHRNILPRCKTEEVELVDPI